MGKRERKPVFKSYTQHQMSLLPQSLEDLIPKNHVVRLVNDVIDKINLESILAKYEGGGASSYHPKMLLKVLIYGYMNNIYSTRKLEDAVAQNIHFMWLAGMSKPDHNTISRFRTGKLSGVFKEIFSQVVLMLVDAGHMDIKQIYTDGTKIESSANRYTFVWGNAIKTSRERIAKQLEELWNHAEQVAKEELLDTRPTTFNGLTPEQVEQTLDRIHEAIKDKPADKKVKQKVNYAKRNWPKNLESYEQKEEVLDGRNSFSKTDPEATFMRMKEDHMNNGQLKPGYNVQVSSTKEEFIAHYTIHQNPTDTKTLIPHITSFNQHLATMPDLQVADAGYGSEENLMYLKKLGVTPYIKYAQFDREQKKGNKARGEYHADTLPYDPEKDVFICPTGNPMHPTICTFETLNSGHTQRVVKYKTDCCRDCPLRMACNNGGESRTININHNLRELKDEIKQRLNTELGKEHRKTRAIVAEGIFGTIKGNWGFRRFLTKGLQKVEVETGLLAMAYNLKKWRKIAQKELLSSALNRLINNIEPLLKIKLPQIT